MPDSAPVIRTPRELHTNIKIRIKPFTPGPHQSRTTALDIGITPGFAFARILSPPTKPCSKIKLLIAETLLFDRRGDISSPGNTALPNGKAGNRVLGGVRVRRPPWKQRIRTNTNRLTTRRQTTAVLHTCPNWKQPEPAQSQPGVRLL